MLGLLFLSSKLDLDSYVDSLSAKVAFYLYGSTIWHCIEYFPVEVGAPSCNFDTTD